ncbi:DUF2812 domain-containing protein [Enterococcus faecium]|nr:DUF2812 domain-containing protein [Enterococcus faecium]
MQEEGYRLVSVSSVVPIYTFEKLASKKKFIPYVRLDFREKSMGKIKYEDYVTLFSDSGWKLIKGSRSGGAQYFQQEYPDVTRDIFSDTDSQESVKKRYVKYGYTYGTLFLLYFFIFFSSNSWNLDKILNFKSWYFTQGLWEMEGMWFWKAFIFETPFVLLHVLLLFFFLFLGIYYLLRSLINDDSTVITKYFV